MFREVKWMPIVFLVTSCLLLVPMFIFPSDWAGWVLVYISLVLPLLFAQVRRDRKLLGILLVIIAVHNAVSIYNSYVATIYGAELDAMNFHEYARDLSLGKLPLWFAEFDSHEVGMSVYTRFLALFYRTFGVSLLIGQSLSVIAYALSCIVFVYLARTLRLRYMRNMIMFLGISVPSIIFCSIIMREAWQVLFFLLTVYFSLQLRLSPSFLKAAGIILSGLLFGVLHNGLFIYSLLLVGLSLYWGASGKWRTAGYKKVMARAAILLLTLGALNIWIYIGGEIGGATRAIRSGEAATYAETYRERGEQDASANYQRKVDTASLVSFLTSGSIVFIYYQFAPFPWEVRRAIDMYASFEGMLRFVLIIYMLRLWWKASGERRRIYAYLITCYFSLEFLWALGTANWGTATRHHIIAHTILVLLGVPGLIYSSARTFQRLRRRRIGRTRRRRVQVKGIPAISS